MYVGPLDDGPDPRCIVEADIATGVRSIRLSELNALQVRVLRPIGLADKDRRRLVEWVVSKIGSDYDLSHAWRLLQNLLMPLLPDCLRSAPRALACSATRFICSSLLAHAFACVGYPILANGTSAGPSATADVASLMPSDFERVPTFEVVAPSTPFPADRHGVAQLA
jgi:hypothetical protein